MEQLEHPEGSQASIGMDCLYPDTLTKFLQSVVCAVMTACGCAVANWGKLLDDKTL